MALAGDVYEARLQVGRVWSGRLLVIAGVLRGLILTVLTFGEAQGGTLPAWVVVSRRDGGSEVARISAGRVIGAGELILESVQASLDELSAEAFLLRWSLREETRC